jgi:hypothetical protein
MFIKITDYPSSIDPYSTNEPYEVIINTDRIISIKRCNTIIDAKEYLDNDIVEDGYVINTEDKNYYITYVDGQNLISKLI